MRDVADLEQQPDGTWRATGYRLDEHGRVADEIGGWRDGAYEVGIGIEAATWEEAADRLHALHPDVPGRDGDWAQVQTDPPRWHWEHADYTARPGSPSNPHVLVIPPPPALADGPSGRS